MDFVIIAHFHSSFYYDGINSHFRALLGIFLVDFPVWFRNLIWFGFKTNFVHLMNLLWTMNIVRFHFLKKFNVAIFRLPVELAGAQSLIPLHSATASALFTSLLSLHNNSWGCLSEGILQSSLLFSYGGL